MNEQLNVTGVGIAVAIAVIVAGGLLFFGPSIFSFFNPQATQTTAAAATGNTTNPTNPNTTTTMNEQDQNTAASGTSDTNELLAGIPATVTQLMSKDLVVGTGAEAKAGDSVTVNYVGMLTNGQVFDASANHGSTGFTFNLGAGQVIKGWDEGVVGMKVGGKRELVIPASMGYGAQAVGPIPANSTLVFEVELTNVQAAH